MVPTTYDIIKAQGGEIKVESKEGARSAFVILLSERDGDNQRNKLSKSFYPVKSQKSGCRLNFFFYKKVLYIYLQYSNC